MGIAPKTDRLSDTLRAQFPSNTGLQRAVGGALVYAGVMTLAVLMLRTWIVWARGAGLPALRTSMWLSSGGAERVRWLFGGVGILLVLYLWVSWRSRRHVASRLVAFQYLGVSLLILLLQWALVETLRGVPTYFLIQVQP